MDVALGERDSPFSIPSTFLLMLWYPVLSLVTLDSSDTPTGAVAEGGALDDTHRLGCFCDMRRVGSW